ncbi:MAG: HD-GYP domain-containing protein [Lachnospiraceae bacterium]
MNDKKILIVNSQEIDIAMISTVFYNEYNIIDDAETFDVAKDKIKHFKNEIALIIIDLDKENLEAVEFIKSMKEEGILRIIPFVAIVTHQTIELQRTMYSLGLLEIMEKSFDAEVMEYKIKNLLHLYERKNILENQVIEQECTIFEQKDLIQKSNYHIIDILCTVVEFRNLELGSHITRMREFTRILATEIMNRFPEYHLSNQEINDFAYAAAMHDVGKIAIPDSILLKPTKLTPEEKSVMKTHTMRGGEIVEMLLKMNDTKYRKICQNIAAYHHEKYDGKGYPKGLMQDEIPIEAQIVGLADVYDSLISERTYKIAYSREKAFDMIMNGECGIFNPKLLECFSRKKHEIEKIVEKIK